jgi:hypothetical protein
MARSLNPSAAEARSMTADLRRGDRTIETDESHVEVARRIACRRRQPHQEETT